MTRVEELIEQVRALPWEEQEEFRLLLYYSEDTDLGLSPEWEAEIVRRIESIENGTAKTYALEEIDVWFAQLKERKHRSQSA